MKKLIALSLAAVVAATSVVATMTSASANDRDDWRRHSPSSQEWRHPSPIIHRDHNWWRGRPGGYTGPFFGSMWGVEPYDVEPYYIEPYPYYGSDAHIAWCLAHYKTYNPATNTFFIGRGVPAVCVSPYPY